MMVREVSVFAKSCSMSCWVRATACSDCLASYKWDRKKHPHQKGEEIPGEGFGIVLSG